jgi:hypothetical protein
MIVRPSSIGSACFHLEWLGPAHHHPADGHDDGRLYPRSLYRWQDLRRQAAAEYLHFHADGRGAGDLPGFRNNASYDRYWEGRKIWGALLIASRALASQGLHYGLAGGDEQRKSLFIARLVALAFALKHQLRKTSAQEDMARLLPQAPAGLAVQYLPVAQMDQLRAMLAAAHRDGYLAMHTCGAATSS